MTRDEKKNPDIINESRRKRIARGAGITEHEVKDLVKQYNSKTMMKQAKGRQMQGMLEIWHRIVLLLRDKEYFFADSRELCVV